MNPCRIVIFAKAPVNGSVKTRLIPALGAEGATALARNLLDRTLRQAMNAGVGRVELCMSPAGGDAWQNIEIPTGVIRSSQQEGSLGERLASASERVIAAGERPILIGTDCPALDKYCLRQIADNLNRADTVMVPTADGGYAALGLSRFHPSLFSSISWSTNLVSAETRLRIRQLGWTVRELPTLHDIDRPEDLQWLPTEFKPVLANQDGTGGAGAFLNRSDSE